jgi:hypothetical protein
MGTGPAEERPATTALARAMMRLFAPALEPPENSFDDQIDRYNSRRRVRSYPGPAEPPVPNHNAKMHCLPTCLARGEAPKYHPTSSGEHLRT